MSKMNIRNLILALPLILIAACIAEAPINVPTDGYWENHAVEYDKNYDKVWDATVQACNEMGWEIKYSDKPTGKVQFITSYVIDPLFGSAQRVYQQPGKAVAEESDVTSYLHSVAYWTKLTPKQAPPNPQFVKEKLYVNVDKVGSDKAKVKANFTIIPYFDYKIGPLGQVRSRGELEEALYARIQQILDSEVIPAPPMPPMIAEVYELNDIFFDFDKSFIRADAIPVLEQNARTMKENPEITIVIHGYADIRGTDAYNLRLAQRRADAAKNYLVQMGINPKRIISLSKGETSKFAYGTTESDFQLNRRARFLAVDPEAPVIYP